MSTPSETPGNETRTRRAVTVGVFAAALAGLGIWAAVGRNGDTGLTGELSTTVSETPETAATPTSSGSESTKATDDSAASADPGTVTQDEPAVEYNSTPSGDPTGTDDLPAAAPELFWAITSESFELVQVESRTGEIVGRYGSWGTGFGSCDGEDGCLFQGLESVQLATDGSLWLTDCCEPAVGNIFTVSPGGTFSPDGSFVTLGSDALLSPDGTTIAYSGLGQLTIADRAAQVPEAVLGGPAGSSGGPDYQPLEWIDEATLLVRVTGDLVDNLVVLDISDPANPQQVGPSMGGLLSHVDAAVRADGNIFALTRSYRGSDGGSDANLAAWVFDPETGTVVAETDLPDDIWEIDYDASGTYLITIGEDSVVRFFGAGRSGVLGEGFISVSW